MRQIILTVIIIGFLQSGKVFSQKNNVEKFPCLSPNETILSLKTERHSNIIFLPGLMQVTQKNNAKNLHGFLKPVTLLDENYYYRQSGFFCRREWEMEKRTAVALRFRLGSLAYTDWLEQKPNAVWRK